MSRLEGGAEGKLIAVAVGSMQSDVRSLTSTGSLFHHLDSHMAPSAKGARCYEGMMATEGDGERRKAESGN